METNNTNIANYLSSDFSLLTSSSSSLRPDSAHQNPRKKRTKFLRMADAAAGEPKTKPVKKPDPSAPKITEPCSECGKRFWSDKALYGHMRCHPERQWRGINPPPTLRRSDGAHTEEDHEVAACLLMLANGPAAASDTTTACTVSQPTPEHSEPDRDPDQNAASCPPTASNCGRFECSSCKKVFSSHQALGGHRASHKNVKGCYAITKNDGEEEGCRSGSEMMMMMTMMLKENNCNSSSNNTGHKCSICSRVFSSGQALGGHMRCHWEKAEEPSSRVCEFDLNLAAPPPLQEDDDASSLPYPPGGLALDLRLGF